MGIPQGSILGPITFLLDMHNLASLTPDSFVIMYADDISLDMSDRDDGVLKNKFNSILPSV